MITDRRRFLRLTGLGALATASVAAGATGTVVTGCSLSGSPGPTSTGSGGSTAATAAAIPTGPPDWAALKSKLAGELLLPYDGEYDSARRPFNALYTARKPAAVARCVSPSDVQACVETARNSRTLIAARSGGHSYAGYSTPDLGLLVDLGRMAPVDVRPDGTAVVGPGARLIDVYAELAKHGRALPAGSCPTVGIAGLTLGGGLGVLTRLHGLTCDWLRAVEVVLADSTVVTASDGELFWALRGGGGGNFGIVTAFTFETIAAPRSLTAFSLRFPAGSVPDVLGGWQEWIGRTPDELWSNCVASAGDPPSCRVGGCFVGTTAALNPLLDSLVRRVGVQPTARTAATMGYLEAMQYFAGCESKPVDQCRTATPTTFASSSRILEAPMRDTAAIAALITGRTGSQGPIAMDVMFDSLGGAVARVAPDATAFPHRQALATVQVYAGGTDRRPVAEVQSALAGLVGRGAYVNYIDPAQRDWGQAYYGTNLERLQAAARRFDPDRVFYFPQSLTNNL